MRKKTTHNFFNNKAFIKICKPYPILILEKKNCLRDDGTCEMAFVDNLTPNTSPLGINDDEWGLLHTFIKPRIMTVYKRFCEFKKYHHCILFTPMYSLYFNLI